MNCQEIARTLDSRDVNGLSASERRACEAHASSCPDCGPTWVVYTRLAAIPVPPMSPEFVARCEALAVAQGRVTPLRRASSRGVLIGTILVVAAAAAMLSMRLVERQPDAPAVMSAVAAINGESSDSGVAEAASTPATDEPLAHEENAAPIDAPAAAITVQVLPLRNEVKHPAGSKAVSSTYAAFIERLRGVPGVTVVVADSGATASPAPNYRITMTGEEGMWRPDSDHKFGGSFQTDILQPNGAVRHGSYGSYSVQIAPGCVTDPRADGLEAGPLVCGDAEGTAANLVGNLRKSEFPPDPKLRRELQSRLLDRSLDVLQRQQALNDLVGFGVGYGGRKASIDNKNLGDPDLIRGALELATTSSDPKVRAAVWTVLRGTGNTGLISPLLAALGRDADSDVRLKAVVVLAGEFAGDARVHAALTVAAKQDTRPLVRALAHRAAGGPDAETDWKKYVVASLKDPSRPAAERVEALLHHMNLGPTSHLFGSDTSNIIATLDMLDDEAIRTLAVTLPEAAKQSPVMLHAAYTLLGNMGQSDRPAVTELLLDLLEGGTAKLSRENTTELLGERAKEFGDARAYAMLEKLSANDPDPRVRQVAADALKAKASAPPSDGQRRLGVSLQVVEARDDIPDDIVGKLEVRSVDSGTVAQKAGVLPLDVLLEINGKPVEAGPGLIQTIQALPKGLDIELLVQRAGKKVRLFARF